MPLVDYQKLYEVTLLLASAKVSLDQLRSETLRPLGLPMSVLEEINDKVEQVLVDLTRILEIVMLLSERR